LVGARVGAALLTNPENSNRHKMLSNGANFEKLIIAILTRWFQDTLYKAIIENLGSQRVGHLPFPLRFRLPLFLFDYFMKLFY
jgi:hypothetical protein